MNFSKYHALGNDYIVLDALREQKPDAETVRRLCDRHFGLGSDGVLWGLLKPGSEAFTELRCQAAAGSMSVTGIIGGLRIFNPDGGEAEKSGNGLRIFSRFLFDQGHVEAAPVRLLTLGGVIESQVLEGGDKIRVFMGRVNFQAANIPVAGEEGEVIQRRLQVKREELVYTAATIGNPHCVILVDNPVMSLSELACRFGPEIERHERFPQRTNVQFMKVLDRRNLEIAIWERGAGYTLASGSSASACAAVARRLAHTESKVAVHSPGGILCIEVDDRFGVTLEGDVTAVAEGRISREIFSRKNQ